MTDILESLGRVLATDVKENLLTTAVITQQNRVSTCFLFADAECPMRGSAGSRGPEDATDGTCGNVQGARHRRKRTGTNLRVLVDELGDVVHLIVDHDVEILLGVVLGNILVGELGGHLDGVVGFFLDRWLIASQHGRPDNRWTRGQDQAQTRAIARFLTYPGNRMNGRTEMTLKAMIVGEKLTPATRCEKERKGGEGKVKIKNGFTGN